MQISLDKNTETEPRLQALQLLNRTRLEAIPLVRYRMFGPRKHSFGRVKKYRGDYQTLLNLGGFKPNVT